MLKVAISPPIFFFSTSNPTLLCAFEDCGAECRYRRGFEIGPVMSRHAMDEPLYMQNGRIGPQAHSHATRARHGPLSHSLLLGFCVLATVRRRVSCTAG